MIFRTLKKIRFVTTLQGGPKSVPSDSSLTISSWQPSGNEPTKILHGPDTWGTTGGGFQDVSPTGPGKQSFGSRVGENMFTHSFHPFRRASFLTCVSDLRQNRQCQSFDLPLPLRDLACTDIDKSSEFGSIAASHDRPLAVDLWRAGTMLPVHSVDQRTSHTNS